MKNSIQLLENNLTSDNSILFLSNIVAFLENSPLSESDSNDSNFKGKYSSSFNYLSLLDED